MKLLPRERRARRFTVALARLRGQIHATVALAARENWRNVCAVATPVLKDDVCGHTLNLRSVRRHGVAQLVPADPVVQREREPLLPRQTARMSPAACLVPKRQVQPQTRYLPADCIPFVRVLAAAATSETVGERGDGTQGLTVQLHNGCVATVLASPPVLSAIGRACEHPRDQHGGRVSQSPHLVNRADAGLIHRLVYRMRTRSAAAGDKEVRGLVLCTAKQMHLCVRKEELQLR